jgi:hypothetical protein
VCCTSTLQIEPPRSQAENEKRRARSERAAHVWMEKSCVCEEFFSLAPIVIDPFTLERVVCVAEENASNNAIAVLLRPCMAHQAQALLCDSAKQLVAFFNVCLPPPITAARASMKLGSSLRFRGKSLENWSGRRDRTIGDRCPSTFWPPGIGSDSCCPGVDYTLDDIVTRPAELGHLSWVESTLSHSRG